MIVVGEEIVTKESKTKENKEPFLVKKNHSDIENRVISANQERISVEQKHKIRPKTKNSIGYGRVEAEKNSKRILK